MADPTISTPTDQTGPLDAGHTTSEYKVTIIATVLSVLATITGVALDLLQSAQSAGIGGKWLPIALSIFGVLGTVLTSIGYQVARSNVKAAAIRASNATIDVTPASTAAAAKNLGA
jgi:hypothetical protein